MLQVHFGTSELKKNLVFFVVVEQNELEAGEFEWNLFSSSLVWIYTEFNRLNSVRKSELRM